MSNIQALLFDRGYWTNSKAMSWLRNHNYAPIKPVHTTSRYLRYRLTEPNRNTRYRTIILGNRIKAIVGYGIGGNRIRNTCDGRGINNQKILAIRPDHYARLLRPTRAHGGDLFSFITSHPDAINNLVGGLHALLSVGAIGATGYAIHRKLRK